MRECMDDGIPHGSSPWQRTRAPLAERGRSEDPLVRRADWLWARGAVDGTDGATVALHEETVVVLPGVEVANVTPEPREF